MKKKMVLTGILIFLFLFGMFAKRERTLEEVLDISEEKVWKCTVEEVYNNGTQWEYKNVGIEDVEEIKDILHLLEETTVSFQTWTWSSDLNEGEYCYDLMIFDGSKHWIRFMENGEIQVLNMGHWVFEVSGEDKQECADTMEEILQEYGVEF